MKIMVCGSMTFSKEMVDAKKKLEKRGHNVKLPCDIDAHLKDSKFIDNLDADLEHCIKDKVLKACFDDVSGSDAVLFLNYPKNGVKGYVGTSSLMEMGIAYHLGKKIFLLFPVPSSSEARWAHEVKIINPFVINSDFNKIK